MQTLSQLEQFREILADYNTYAIIGGQRYTQETSAMIIFHGRLTISVTIKNKNGVSLGRLELRENEAHTEFNIFTTIPTMSSRTKTYEESLLSNQVFNHLLTIAQPLAALCDAKLNEVQS